MNSITDKDSLQTRFSRDPEMDSAVLESTVPSNLRTGVPSTTRTDKQLNLPHWLRALWSPKVLAPCLIVLAVAGQAAWGFVPFLPGAWTGVSGKLTPIASTFEEVTVLDNGAPHAAPKVVRIRPDGSFRVLLAPGTYTIWVTDNTCAGTPLVGGVTVSLGSGQHTDVGEPPFLGCDAVK